ncbi:MAG: glycoside hydrolase family 2 TIM barrel-domain containing protein [Mangrovibacterium sp.]
MRKMIMVIMAVLYSTVSAYSQTSVTKIVPIVSDNQIKLEVTLSNGKKGPAKINGKITSCKNGNVIWDGMITRLKMPGVSDTMITCYMTDIKADLWTPATPDLYQLEVSCDQSVVRSRIGFRKFEMIGGQFYLNGKPIFLRGNAINPPERGIPTELETSTEFARDYIRFLKGMNINMIRIPDNQNWMDVCDEEGMMIFGGRYGRPQGATAERPPLDLKESVRIYKETELGPFTAHPSVMIYVLSNEMPYKGETGEAYRKFLQNAYEELIKWDHTKQYICNAGYGLGRSADVYDVHRYWGWYYNTYFTFLNLRDRQMWQNEGKEQAITFTECVGNYTGIDGRFNLCSRTKQPGSQKCWTGHLPEDEQGDAALNYQADVLKNVTEMFRRFRPQNPRLGGVMPFTIIFHHWDGIKSFAEMKPKPAAYQYGISYQPILLSWELWQMNVYAGKEFQAVVHVVNDDDLTRDLEGAKIVWSVEDLNRIPVLSGEVGLPSIPYYDTFRKKLKITVPEFIPAGYYTLKGTVMQNGKVVSTNSTELFIAVNEWKNTANTERKIRLLDPKGSCEHALQKCAIPYSKIENLKGLDPDDVLLIAEFGWNRQTDPQTDLLEQFIRAGGRVVCLRQQFNECDMSWIPVPVKWLKTSNNDPTYPPVDYSFCDGMNINLEKRDHPVFAGLSQDLFRLWSDYTDFDESKPGFPAVYPVTNGYLVNEADLTQVSVLANYSRNLSATALSEIKCGEGSVLLSAFDLTSRIGQDPVADKLFINLMNYAASDQSPEIFPVVDHTIFWGNYQSEAGIVSGANNGLIINTVPVSPVNRQEEYKLKVDDLGYHYTVSYGGWNNRPGVQYMIRGRRPFAPYGYSSGGSYLVEDKFKDEGSGYFLARVATGKTKMLTLVENPTDRPITISIRINSGTIDKHVLDPHSKKMLTSLLPQQRDLKVTFRGDRSAVILTTDFK